MKRGALALALALVSSLGGACSCGADDTTAQRSNFAHSMLADDSGTADFLIDFGEVLLGDRKTEVVQIRNRGNQELAVDLEGLELPFLHDLPRGGMEVGVGEADELRFGFEPLEETEGPLETIVQIFTNEAGGKSYSVRLVGRGLKPALDCAPSRIDFGSVLRGTTSSLSTSCTNSLSIPLELKVDGFRGAWGQYFNAEVAGASDGWVSLAGGEAVEIQIHFQAESVGNNEATLELHDPYGQKLASIAASAETVISTTVVSPSCLDFSYVSVGSSERGFLEVQNVGTAPISIRELRVPEANLTDFSVLTKGPLHLEPRAAPSTIEVEFHPATGGAHQTEVELHVEEGTGADSVVFGCAKGFGGGPVLQCDQEVIDFGMVAAGMPLSRHLSCWNAGEAAAGVSMDPLVVKAVVSSDTSFEVVEIKNEDSSSGLKAEGYESGERFLVEVSYAPEGERFDSAELTIVTSTPEGDHRISIAGQGRVLPPCDFELRSPLLRFGVVERGEELTLPLSITNLQETACLINDLRLTEESDPAFTVETVESYELRGFETLRLDVSFAPPEHRALFEGAIQFRISDPARAEQRVELRGTSAKPCLIIEPAEVDFGRVAPGCMTHPVAVRASNVCAIPLTVASMEIADVLDAERFEILQRPSEGRMLSAGQWIEILMSFAPEDERLHEGALILEIEGGEPYVARLLGEGSSNPLQTDVFDQRQRPKVDILWVMDNSGSFESYQRRIAENLPAFLDSAMSQQIDFRIAVTTSGLAPADSLTCPGGAHGGEDGRFFPIDGSSPRILTPHTPDLATHWANIIRVGTCHGREEYLEAGLRALSKPLIDEVKSSKHWDQTQYNDGNAGFLRRDASLSIVFVADEQDQSFSYGRIPADYLRFFRGLKPHGMFKAHAITGGRFTGPTPPSCGAEQGDRILDLVDATEGTFLDICTPTDDEEAWISGLRLMSEGVFSVSGRFVLRGPPSDRNGDGIVNEEDIEVAMDGEILTPNASGGQEQWRYDSLMNAITFGPLFVPRPGSQISATYQVGCVTP